MFSLGIVEIYSVPISLLSLGSVPKKFTEELVSEPLLSEIPEKSENIKNASDRPFSSNPS